LHATKITALIVVACSIGQNISAQIERQDLARMPLKSVPLESVLIEDESFVQLLARFSSAYNVPFGFEIARGSSEPGFYRINLKKGTLSDLLNQFVTQHKEYSWRIEDGVINVFPKENYRDPIVRELLETKIRDFSVAEKTSTMAFGKNLLSSPEIKRILELYGITYDAGDLGGFYIQRLGQRYSFHASNMQLKSILDRVVKESPVARN
jgi:phage pi2 protein 07